MSEQTTLETQEEQKQEVSVVEEKTTQVQVQPTKMVTDYSLGIFGSSDNWNMAGAMAKQLAKSSLVPKEYQNNVSNCIIAIDQAQRLGVSPMMVMQNLDIIQGRPSWNSKFLIAAVNASGKFDQELAYEEEEKDGKPYSCVAWTTRNGRRVDGMKITMDMARDEGWLSKNGSKWKTMPQLMLRYRAASFFARLNCPEVTLGMYTQDEVRETDFNDDPPDIVIEKVQDEVEQNANSIPFNPED